MAALRGAETIGRPLGSPAFLDRVATQTGAIRDRRGPKPAANKGFSKVSQYHKAASVTRKRHSEITP